MNTGICFLISYYWQTEKCSTTVHFSYQPLKWPLQIYFACRFKVGTLRCKMLPILPLHAQQFPRTSTNPENGQKRPFLDSKINSFESGTRFTVSASLYSRPIFPLSNGAYRMSLKLWVAEQLARDRSGRKVEKSSRTRDRTGCPRLASPRLSHWATRSVMPVASRFCIL